MSGNKRQDEINGPQSMPSYYCTNEDTNLFHSKSILSLNSKSLHMHMEDVENITAKFSNQVSLFEK